jgi:hypothetical protein
MRYEPPAVVERAAINAPLVIIATSSPDASAVFRPIDDRENQE